MKDQSKPWEEKCGGTDRDAVIQHTPAGQPAWFKAGVCRTEVCSFL